MTPLFNKLNFKKQKHICVLNPPDSFGPELKAISEHTHVSQSLAGDGALDFVMVFVLNQEQIKNSIDSIFPKLNGDAILWYCYPKSTSKRYKCDFNRDSGWEVLGKYNMEGVRQVAIDEDWSALRFRKVEFIKSLQRRESFALSVSGRARLKK